MLGLLKRVPRAFDLVNPRSDQKTLKDQAVRMSSFLRRDPQHVDDPNFSLGLHTCLRRKAVGRENRDLVAFGFVLHQPASTGSAQRTNYEENLVSSRAETQGNLCHLFHKQWNSSPGVDAYSWGCLPYPCNISEITETIVTNGWRGGSSHDYLMNKKKLPVVNMHLWK